MEFKQRIYGRRKIISWRKRQKAVRISNKYKELNNGIDILQADDLASESSFSSEESSSNHDEEDENEEEDEKNISYDTKIKN